MKKWIHRLTRIELVLIYLVIIAGSVVRMTGSGMGCPDWPKCFGHLIPPTDREELEWHPYQEFRKDQIIIVDESLRVAREDFRSGSTYDETRWDSYTKHDYAIFNPFHTWTEYINRLVGALSGLPMLILVGMGALYVRRNWRFFVLSLLGLFLLGFEAWLGKLVVDGNLIPGSITIHMLGALAIVAILLLQLTLSSDSRISLLKPGKLFQSLLFLSLLFTLVQIVLGTQVREQIDYLSQDGLARSSWVDHLDWQFYIHRSFSILVFALNLWLWWKNRKAGYKLGELNAIILLIVAEVILGIILAYFNMPSFAQPLHLLLGTILLAFQLYALIRISRAKSESRIQVS